MSGDGHFDWQDEQLAFPERAVDGEPCVVCDARIAPNAHWKYRDRHVCSSKCNRTVKRRLKARIDRGEVVPPDFSPPPPGDERIRHAQWFGTDEGAEFPFEFEGPSPRIGDAVERFGEVTYYESAAAVPLPPRVLELINLGFDGTESLAAAVHLGSGAMSFVKLDSHGWLTELSYGEYAPDGRFLGNHERFLVDGRELVWSREFIRDLNEDGEPYTWEAPICVPADIASPTYWTPAFAARSAASQRTSASTARHRRRLRVASTRVERIDPCQVFERDEWRCQLCGLPVDKALHHPDPFSASLDHAIPLAAGGTHPWNNVQLAHLQCNVRKGSRTDWMPPIHET